MLGSMNECSKQQRLNCQYLKGTLWVSFAKVRAEKLKLSTLWKGFLQDILAVQYEDLAIGKHTHIYTMFTSPKITVIKGVKI